MNESAVDKSGDMIERVAPRRMRTAEEIADEFIRAVQGNKNTRLWLMHAVSIVRREAAEDMRERAAAFIGAHTTESGTCEIVKAIPGGESTRVLAGAIRNLPLDTPAP